MANTAIGLDIISRIVGYLLEKGNFVVANNFLPQRIAIFGEANHANQGTLNQNGVEITSAKQAGELYGYGSPIHMMMRILRPFSGDGLGGIPTVVFAQPEPVGAAAKVLYLSITGTPNGNGTHYLKIAGRQGMDGDLYDINILSTDSKAQIYQKIADTVNSVLGCPMIGDTDGYEAILTSKWRGLTADDITVSVVTGNNDLGLTYTVTNHASASGTPSIASALNQFGNAWNTIVLNGYGTVAAIMDALQQFNGIPLSPVPTGRYVGSTWKPFIALTGSTADNPSAITDARANDVTIAICPAPLSPGLPFEAAANMLALFASIAQNTPHLDVSGQSYPDMPTPDSIGSMALFANRESFVRKGCSTVDLVSGKYQVQDFITTYHPVGENPPQYRYCRNLMLDMNVRYRYLLLERIHVIDHAIANDNDNVDASNVIKPKQWKALIADLSETMVKDAWIVDSDFLIDSLTVRISSVNPDRFETFFRYKRSGFVRQSATNAQAGFNYGTLTT
jgi:phage tail sheath gpL-like